MLINCLAISQASKGANNKVKKEGGMLAKTSCW